MICSCMHQCRSFTNFHCKHQIISRITGWSRSICICVIPFFFFFLLLPHNSRCFFQSLTKFTSCSPLISTTKCSSAVCINVSAGITSIQAVSLTESCWLLQRLFCLLFSAKTTNYYSFLLMWLFCCGKLKNRNIEQECFHIWQFPLH